MTPSVAATYEKRALKIPLARQENPDAASANGLDSLVHIINVQTEMSDAVPVVVNTVAIYIRNVRLSPGTRGEDKRQSAETYRTSPSEP